MKLFGIPVEPCECGGWPTMESKIGATAEHYAKCMKCQKKGPSNFSPTTNIGAHRAVFEWNRDRLKERLYPT